MRHRRLFVSLLSASSLFFFAGIACAQPGPGPGHAGPGHAGPGHAGPAKPGPGPHCDCAGKPGCHCDDHHPGPKPGAVPPPPKPAPKPIQPPPMPHHVAPPPPPAPHMPPPPPAHHDHAMHPDDFNRLVSSIEHQVFSSDKKLVVDSAIAGNKFTCDQVRIIMQRFTFDNDRVDVAAKLYHHVVDRQNWYIVYDALEFQSSRQSLEHRTR